MEPFKQYRLSLRDPRVLHQNTKAFLQAWQSLAELSEIKKIFGIEKDSAAVLRYSYGSERPNDHLIIKEIIYRLSNKRSAEPLKILEVGAGVSHPFFKDLGSPWISRGLQRAFRGAIDLTAVDENRRAKSDLLFALVDQDQHFDSMLLKTNERLPFSHFVKVTEGGPRLRPARLTEQDASCLNASKAVFSESLGEMIEKAEALKAFIRPQIDPRFEREIYDIKFLDNESVLTPRRLQKHTFDVVFARYLWPTEAGSQEMRAITGALNEMLKPGGAGYATFDALEKKGFHTAYLGAAGPERSRTLTELFAGTELKAHFSE